MKVLEVREMLKEKGIKSITYIGNLSTSRNVFSNSDRDLSSFSFKYRGIDFSYIVNFYYSFNNKKWENTNSVKICNIVYSKIQAISKMIKHYCLKCGNEWKP